MTESEAIEQLCNGNLAGLELLVQTYYFQALRAAFFITQDKWLAEDIVQTAFIRVYENIRQFDRQRPFRPWFLQIVSNDALKAVTRTKPTVSANNPNIKPILTDLPDSSSLTNPETLLEQVETRQELWQALQKLTPLQRKAVVERYFLGLNESQMSQQNNLDPQVIRSRLHSARLRLRALISSKRS